MGKSVSKKIILFGCGAVVVLSLAFRDDLFQVSKNLDIFTSLYKELNINYVDEVNSSDLIQTGIDAMLNGLDPYTEFVPESEIEDYKMKYVSTQYGGIGASILSRNGKVYISEPYYGFPAQKADLRAGDQILQINSIPLKGKDNEAVSLLLKGPKGTPLKILIQRNGIAKPVEKTVLREDITQNNVSYQGMLQDNIGYIKLDKFLENSSQEVKDALIELQKNNVKGLVLDLRYNGGGILQEAVKIVNLFVDKDVTVVTQKGRVKEKSVIYKTLTPALAPDLPLIVLINSRSASAAEIVAGALQDLDRAVIIGQRSFGKGLVQQTFNLPYNSLVKVTIAKYFTPSGRCIQALNYTHKAGEGSVVKVADSLISEYKTRAGRSVYDGSGIYPDISTDPIKYNAITQTLVNKFLIFDYVTKYRNSNSTIANAREFQLSDKDYSDFVNYLSDKDYNYSTETEKILLDLKYEAEKEKKLAEIKNEYEALKSKVFYSKKNDLFQNKEEIRRVLENEIVSRYYFQQGRIEHGFKYDQDIKTALEVVNNTSKLSSILHGQGNYKYIGTPDRLLSANSAK
ncbi:S41 family peptidase [Rubrolithibacter danxiaensis]|uniref:S41 family peptidase n=1 Tax=Rubrolithibacter danxiaensis TaxID=3390805 RepID=UPI003BF78BE1